MLIPLKFPAQTFHMVEMSVLPSFSRDPSDSDAFCRQLVEIGLRCDVV